MSEKLIIVTPPSTNGFDAESRGLNGLFIRMCYSRLFAYPANKDNDGNLIGDTTQIEGVLADSYEVSDDKMTYLINLKKGVSGSSWGNIEEPDVLLRAAAMN